MPVRIWVSCSAVRVRSVDDRAEVRGGAGQGGVEEGLELVELFSVFRAWRSLSVSMSIRAPAPNGETMLAPKP